MRIRHRQPGQQARPSAVHRLGQHRVGPIEEKPLAVRSPRLGGEVAEPSPGAGVYPGAHHAGNSAERGHEIDAVTRLIKEGRSIGRPLGLPLRWTAVRRQRDGLAAADLTHEEAHPIGRALGVRHQLAIGRERRIQLEAGIEGDLRGAPQLQPARLRPSESQQRQQRDHPDGQCSAERPGQQRRSGPGQSLGETLQLVHDLLRILPAIRWILGQAALDHLGQGRRDVGPARGDRWRLLQRVRRDDRAGASGERRPAGEHLVAQHAKGVDVGPMVHIGIGGGLLRRHVGRRADGDPRGRQCRYCSSRLAQRLGHPEVCHQHVAAREQHVVGLHVPVHHAVGMRVGQRVGGLPQQASHFGHGKPALALELLPQGLALDVRHHIEQEAVGLARVEHRQDMRMLQLGRDLDLAGESVRPQRRRQIGTEHLHRDLSPVPQIFGEIYRGHAAAPQLAGQDVAAGKRGMEAIEAIRHVGPGWDLRSIPGRGRGGERRCWGANLTGQPAPSSGRCNGARPPSPARAPRPARPSPQR